MKVFMIGPPCSGKSTLARLLAARVEWRHLSTGDIARELAETDEETRRALAAGSVAPPEIMDARVLDTLYPVDAPHEPMVVDGYPRYISQLEDVLSRERDTSNLWFVLLTVPRHIARRRCRSRAREDWANFDTRWSHFHTVTKQAVSFIRESPRLSHRLIVLDGTDVPVDNAHLLSLRVYDEHLSGFDAAPIRRAVAE